MTRVRDAPPGRDGQGAPPGAGRTALVLGLGIVALVVVAGIHVGQGAAGVTAGEVLAALLGEAGERAEAVTRGARLPRLLAGLVSGAALGVAGTLLQTVTRNPLAEPATLGLNAGAYLAVVATTAFGISLGPVGELGVAALGAVAAAGLVVLVAAGTALTPARLVLAGVAVSLALAAFTAALLLRFEQRTGGLFLWGQGTLAQLGLDQAEQAWPRLLVGLALALALARALDVLGLGEDTAAGLGLPVRAVQLGAVGVAVLLVATAATLTGPISFVGLAAPHVVRLAGVRRHVALLAGAAVWGALLLLGADTVARGVRSTALGSELPAGVVTALVGAPLFVWLARRMAAGSAPAPSVSRRAGRRPSARPRVVVGTLAASLLAVIAAAVMVGDLAVPVGDLLAALRGRGGPLVERVVLDLRLPRTVVAALAGGCLATSGALLQAITRNPLAAPSVVGVTGGAGLGALTVLLVLPGVPASVMPLAAFAGAVAVAGVVYGLSWRGGLAPDVLLLVGVALAAATAAGIDLLVVTADLRLASALTWLAGSTYARTWSQAGVLAGWAVVLLPAAAMLARQLDLFGLGEDLPRSLGLRLERARMLTLAVAVLLAAVAVSVVGAMAFVGLVAPHAARLLVGARHRTSVPAAALLGAVLVVVADALGRSVFAPAEVPSGLVTALLGAPYFVWLLRRSRG